MGKPDGRDQGLATYTTTNGISGGADIYALAACSNKGLVLDFRVHTLALTGTRAPVYTAPALVSTRDGGAQRAFRGIRASGPSSDA